LAIGAGAPFEKLVPDWVAIGFRMDQCRYQ
jgi:hypothetical protein